MEINCPECDAKFSVPDDKIGPKGRKLKCARCKHVWHQTLPRPEADEPEPLDLAEEPAAPPPPTPAPRAAESPASAPPDTGGMPMEETEPERPRTPAPEPSSGGLDIPLESDPGEPEEDARPSFSFDTDQPMSSDGDGAEDRPDPLDDLDSLPENEDIPGMFSGSGDDDDDDDAGGKGGGLVKALLALVLVLGAVGAGLFFGRDYVVRFVPVTAEYYEMVGIPVDVAGLGLQFSNVSSERVIQENVERLLVRGTIDNTSEVERTLPMIKLVLYDASDASIQTVTAQPPVEVLPPGETAEFRVKMDYPAAAARRFEVTFTRAE